MVITRELREEIEAVVSKAVSECIKSEVNIKEIVSKVSLAITKTINDKLVNVEKSMAELKKKFEEDNKKLADKIVATENKMILVSKENDSLTEKLDIIDQKSRSCNLRIFNLKDKQEDTKNEIRNLLQSKMALNLKDEDIQVCYRIGKKEKAKPRGIFLRLASLDLKQIIYSKKKLLKGTGVVIREDLTSVRVQLLNDAIDKVGLKNAWTENGKIYVHHVNKIFVIKNKTDLTKVLNTL